MTETDTDDDSTDDEGDGTIDGDEVTDAAVPIRERVPWRRIANAIGLVVLIAAVLPFVIYAVPQVAGADGSYVVLSGSMEPEISPGDVIVVESVEPSTIEEGDVITYARGEEGQTTTHRVVEVDEREGGYEFRTKGDANEEPDREPVAGSRVEGRVMTVGGHLFVIPFIGHVVQFVGTPLGFAALVVAPIVAFVLSEVWNLVASSTGTASAEESDGRSEGDREAGDEPAASAGGRLTLGADELGLGLLVTGAFVTYSVWVAYVTLAAWAVGVAASVTTTFLLLLGLYVSGRSAETGDDPSAAEGSTGKTPGETGVEPGDGGERSDPTGGTPSLAERWGTGDDPDGAALADESSGEEPPSPDEPTVDESKIESPVDAPHRGRAGGNDDD